MAETATAATGSTDNQSAPWMAALAEQQRTIRRLMERIEILEGRKADPDSSPAQQWNRPEQRAPSLHSGRASASPTSSHPRSPSSNRPQSTHANSAASVTSRASGGGSSAASAAGNANRFNSTTQKSNSNQLVCRYGSKCKRPRQECYYQHPDGAQSDRTEISPSDTISTRPKKSCFKGLSCSRPNCRYEHPDGWNPYSATEELPAQPESESSNSQQTVDTWAPVEDSSGGWDSAPNLSSWAETPAANDWGIPASDWGPAPTAKNTWDTTGNQTQDTSSQTPNISSQRQDPPPQTSNPSLQNRWGEVGSSGWGEVASSGWGEAASSGWGADNGEAETVTSQASSTPTPGSSSKRKGKNPKKKENEAKRLARRQAEKEAQLAFEAAAASTNVPSERPTPVLSPEPTRDRSDNLANESTLDFADDAVTLQPTHESANGTVDEPVEVPANELTTEPASESACEPTGVATVVPPHEPTAEPVIEPVQEPMVEPTAEPAIEPTVEHTVEHTAEPAVEPTAEPVAEPVVEPAVEPLVEPVVESAESHDSVDASFAASETSDTQETPPLEPSAASPILSTSESDMPQTPDRLVWSDEPQEDFPVVDFADLPSTHDPSEYVEDEEEYVPEPMEEPSLDNTRSMIYSSWDNVTPSAADWGFDTSEFDTPAPDPAPAPTPAPVITSPPPAKKSVKSKGKQKAVEKASNAFNYQPQNIGAPRSSSHKPVSNATPMPPTLMPPPIAPEPEAEPESVVAAPEPPKGVPEEDIPDWLLGGGVDAHEVLGISRPATPEPSASSSSTPQPTGPPKTRQTASSNSLSLGGTVLPKPQPKAAPAPKPVVRARPVGWKIVDNPNPPGTSAWATASANVTPTTKGKRVVRPKTKK